MEQLLSTSPYPILRVREDGIVVYANEASFPLLAIWEINRGEKLPSNIMAFVRKAILKKGTQDVEVKEREYSLTFKSPGDGYIYIYGLDLTSLKPTEKKNLTPEKQHDILSKSQHPPVSADFRNLMDQAAEIVSLTIKVESCNIFEISHSIVDFSDSRCSAFGNENDSRRGGSAPYEEKAFFPAVSLKHSGSTVDGQRICNGISIQGIGFSGQINLPDAPSSGITVFLRSQGKTCMGITLQKSRHAEFTPQEVRFLRYILSLALKVRECKDIDTKLQDRVRFLGRLIQKVPGPAYFKDVNQTIQSYNELFTGKNTGSSNIETAENSILELEKIIPTELKAIYKKKNQELSIRFGGLPVIMPDICIFRESEETLKMALEVQKVLWTVINNSPAIIFLWRNEDKWPADFVTENVSQFGYTAEDFTSGKVLYGDIIHREDLDRVQAELEHQTKTGNETFRSEYRIYTKSGSLRWVDERTFIQRNKAGKVTYFQGIVIDITERKVAEEAVEKAEQLQKKEINHRIKNNLQIVASLLDLQAEKFDDRKVIEAFRESESRILSMSLIHQELYESGKLDSLDFSSYLRKLITDLIRSYKTENCRIQVNLNANSVFLGVDTAVSLGIIINEFFTNAIKYAFPAETNGEIYISLLREGDKEENGNKVSNDISSSRSPDLKSSLSKSRTCEHFTLVFADNGKGFPEDIDFRNSTSLGLQLVNTLVDQIVGNIELERNIGTKFIIKFKGEVQYSS